MCRVRYRRKLSKVKQKWQAGLLRCRLSKGKQTADPQDCDVACAFSADRHGTRRHRGGGIENDEDPNNVTCYGPAQNDLLHQRDGSVRTSSSLWTERTIPTPKASATIWTRFTAVRGVVCCFSTTAMARTGLGVAVVPTFATSIRATALEAARALHRDHSRKALSKPI